MTAMVLARANGKQPTRKRRVAIQRASGFVARATLTLLAKEFIEGTQSNTLSLADRERLLRMYDMAHRMGHRALGAGDTSE